MLGIDRLQAVTLLSYQTSATNFSSPHSQKKHSHVFILTVIDVQTSDNSVMFFRSDVPQSVYGGAAFHCDRLSIQNKDFTLPLIQTTFFYYIHIHIVTLMTDAQFLISNIFWVCQT